MSGGLPTESKSWLKRLHVQRIAAVAGTLLLAYSGASAVAVQGLSPVLGPRYQVADPKTIGPNAVSVNFKSTDGVPLTGSLYQGVGGEISLENRTSVLFVPGLQSTRATSPAPQIIKQFLKEGFDVLTIDPRGQGLSGDVPVTLGDKERYDVLGAYHYMKSLGYSPDKMVVVGVSMGGAATILASPQMPDVGAIVIISSYAELEPMVRRQLFDQNPALVALEPGIKVYARVMWGMNLDVNPANVVAGERDRAFLFIQGGDDGFVTPDNGQELFKASKNPQTTLVVLPRVGHSLDGISPAEMKKVQTTVALFITQQLAEHQQVS